MVNILVENQDYKRSLFAYRETLNIVKGGLET